MRSPKVGDRWLRSPIAFLLALFLTLPAAHAQNRPLVVVFSASLDAADTGVKKDGGDGLSREARTAAGTRFVSSCLSDSGAVIAIRYDPKSSMVVRAENEANLHIVNPDDPTPAERLQIAKAIRGAVYMVAVSTQIPADAPGGNAMEMTIEGVNLDKGKSYSDHVRASTKNLTLASGDSDAVRHFTGNDQLDNILQSAANTLVQRLLVGPLADYSRSVPPANLVPKTVVAAPSPDVIRPTAPVPPPDNAPADNLQVPGDPRFGVADTTSATTVTTTHVASKVVLGAKENAAESSKPSADAIVGAPATAATPRGDSHAYTTAAAHSAGAPNEEATAAIQQSGTLATDGDMNAAILMLREAIDRQPLSPALRIALAKTYLTAHRDRDAESEARRALTVLPALPAASQTDLTTVLNQSITATGDLAGARATYQRIVGQQPTAYWARVALAEMDLNEGQNEEAEAQYRAVLKADPTAPTAVAGVARLQIERGDNAGAQAILNASGSATSRNLAAVAVFDGVSRHVAERITKNRSLWEAGSLSREAIGTATTAQATRIAALIALLKANPPAADADANDIHAQKRRLLAATLLSQAANDLIAFIQTGDTDAGADSGLQLVEFDRTLTEAQGK